MLPSVLNRLLQHFLRSFSAEWSNRRHSFGHSARKTSTAQKRAATTSEDWWGKVVHYRHRSSVLVTIWRTLFHNKQQPNIGAKGRHWIWRVLQNSSNSSWLQHPPRRPPKSKKSVRLRHYLWTIAWLSLTHRGGRILWHSKTRTINTFLGDKQ